MSLLFAIISALVALTVGGAVAAFMLAVWVAGQLDDDQ